VCWSEVDTHFVLEPASDAIVGYVSITPGFDHGITPTKGGFFNLDAKITELVASVPRRVPLLSQLYVEPEVRKRGLATAALRVLLAGVHAVVVDAPALATARSMLRLGFKAVGTKQVTESHPRVLYVRAEALTTKQNEENC
jgi:GNAT superfamily N-acetyltransferase